MDTTEILLSVLNTPIFKKITAMMQAAEARGHRDHLQAPGQRPAPLKHTNTGAPEKYSERLAERAIDIASQSLAKGRRMDYREAQRLAAQEIGPPPVSRPARYTERRDPGATVETYRERLSLEAIDIASRSLAAGRMMPYAEASRQAALNIGPPPPLAT